MADNWNSYANSKIDMRKMTYKARTSDRIINSIILLHTAAIFAYCINIVTANVDVSNKTVELPFVSKVDIPINFNTEYTYRCVSIMLFLHTFMCAWAAGVTNGLLSTLVS